MVAGISEVTDGNSGIDLNLLKILVHSVLTMKYAL